MNYVKAEVFLRRFVQKTESPMSDSRFIGLFCEKNGDRIFQNRVKIFCSACFKKNDIFLSAFCTKTESFFQHIFYKYGFIYRKKVGEAISSEITSRLFLFFGCCWDIFGVNEWNPPKKFPGLLRLKKTKMRLCDFMEKQNRQFWQKNTMT